jgi:hypothetical protein
VKAVLSKRGRDFHCSHLPYCPSLASAGFFFQFPHIEIEIGYRFDTVSDIHKNFMAELETITANKFFQGFPKFMYATNQKVAGSIPDEVNFLIYLILPVALGPGVYSTSNRNEHQKH